MGKACAEVSKGSPPHGRGKVRTPIISHFRGGITPAWAGKRDSSTAEQRICKDHPRVGGEKLAAMAAALS